MGLLNGQNSDLLLSPFALMLSVCLGSKSLSGCRQAECLCWSGVPSACC